MTPALTAVTPIRRSPANVGASPSADDILTKAAVARMAHIHATGGDRAEQAKRVLAETWVAAQRVDRSLAQLRQAMALMAVAEGLRRTRMRAASPIRPAQDAAAA